MLHDDAVLASQGHDIGDGGDGDQLQKRLDHAIELRLRPAESGKNGVRELQCDARSAEVGIGITAIAAAGINDGERGRQFGFRQVVIGDNDIDSQFTRRARWRRMARMPLSTLIMTRTPRRAASSTAAVCIP